MQLPYSWIKELVDISWPAPELAGRLTLAGAETETEPVLEKGFDNICVGRIEQIENIEGTDHLKKALVDIGREKLQVVCGAPNARGGQKVVVAKIGAELQGGIKIKKSKIRGVESSGMICAEDELGLSDDHSGIMVLDEDAPIGAPIDDVLKVNDYILNLDLTPNRADLLSAIGVARDTACLAGLKMKKPEIDLIEVSEKASDYIKIRIDNPEACQRYTARIIKGVKIGLSPWWIRRKLLLCGIRPISNVVDITNLVMMEYGQPLHAFDYRKFSRGEIVVRRAFEGEMFTTLDGREHKLTPDVLMITDGRQGVGTAGVMGGLDSEVSEDTVDILLESAYFDPVTIRKSRMLLGLNTESSYRFERGVDPNIVPIAANRAACLMQKFAGGSVLSGLVDCYPEPINPAEIELRPERVRALLGVDIPTERIIKILRDLEYEVEDRGKLHVKVPTFAVDVKREVDLIEEIIRIEGFESIPFIDRNNGPLFTPGHPDDVFRSEIRRILTAQGFDEIYSSGLGHSRQLSKLGAGDKQLKILNPIAEDLDVLQNTLIYSLLKSTAHNIAHRNVDLALFEIGKAFNPGNPPAEQEIIGIIMTGRSVDKWFGRGREYSFYELKGALETLAGGCRCGEIAFVGCDQKPFIKGLAFKVNIGSVTIGRAGQIDPEIAREFDIKQPVFAAEIDFDGLLGSRQDTAVFKPLPRYPAAPRDIAIVVDESVRAGDILEEIKKAGGKLLESVEIFDLYRGKQIGSGKKSLAFAMIFRSAEGSLENAEVVDLQRKIAEHLKRCFKAEVREG
nr:phenylalanine--tRNA ligase subunit beta [candidate division Zixibacteria bacterium]